MDDLDDLAQQLEQIKKRVESNQDQLLDMYREDHPLVEMMKELLCDASDLLKEIEPVEKQVKELAENE